ncbi:MAG: imelysin [Chitinophagales bacterium]|nr:imelysin [Chitinophagales bacterium]
MKRTTVKYRTWNVVIPFISASIFMMSCDDEKPTDTDTFDSSAILKNVSENVITATYSDLHLAAEAMVTSFENLQTSPTEANLEIAKQKWRDARVFWEQSEGFLFGPVATKAIDPAIDSWPVNVVDLENVLSGTETLTKEYIDGLEGTLKGFHTIEYLIWGADGNKTVDAITDREFEYLISLANSLESETEILFTSWDASGENFQDNITLAGQSASIYPSQKSAMQELINGMIGIADEVANGKINDPLTTGDVTLEESRFSANSKADFADNIRSIQNTWSGNYGTGGNGNGVKDFVANFDQALADELEADIQEAIDDIENITGTFTEAIFANPEEIEHAQEMILDVKLHLESEVLPLLDEL